MNINAQTKIFGIIGHPLGHTFSPAMHNAGFEKLKYNAVYLAFPMKNIIQLKYSMRQMNIKGLSVTIPFKVKIRRITDVIDPLALQIGSVNTLLPLETGLLKGYNTDGLGAITAIKEAGFKIEDKKILIIGSGGSARAIAFSIMQENPNKLGFLARNKKSVKHLMRSLLIVKKKTRFELYYLPSVESSNQTKKSQKIQEMILKNVKKNLKKKVQISYLLDPEQLKEYDLVIQTTPIGMKGSFAEEEMPYTEKFIHPHQTFFDIVYNPIETPFVKVAKRKKADIIHGYNMLLHQGTEQFKLFTGLEAPKDVMLDALLKELKGRK